MAEYQTVFEVLDAVDSGFDSEDKWTKGVYACKRNGEQCSETDPDAALHCLAGKIIEATAINNHICIANEVGDKTLKFVSNIINREYNVALHVWNDARERTFKDIKNLLKHAKEECKLQHE